MNEPLHSTDRERLDFDRLLADSADLFGDVATEVEPTEPPDGFIVHELTRLLEEGEASFDSDAFRFLIRQGIRLQCTDDVGLRARFVGRLRQGASGFSGRARKALPHVVGALEDVDFPLDRVGMVVRYYTHQLFHRVEQDETPPPDSALQKAIAAWSSDMLPRDRFLAALREANADTAPLVAEVLFENAADYEIASGAIDTLARLAQSARDRADSPARAGTRALAYAISEPVLDEQLEAKVCGALLDTWPLARTYILYNLRKHEHEDIPFRWLELLIRSQELRAVDRILEEVLVHASDATYREDLLSSLDLLADSEDPGRNGKILRLVAGPGVPETVGDVLADWRVGSGRAGFLEADWREGDPEPDFVHLDEDFADFACRLSDISMEQVYRRWKTAFHESLGWIEWQNVPRSDAENRVEAEIEHAIVSRLSFRNRPDAGTLRGLVEAIRKNTLGLQPDGTVPLVFSLRSRPRSTPWLEAIYWRDINQIYIQAAESFDTDDPGAARDHLDTLRAIEPGYPLAVMLDGVMGSRQP